MKTNIIFYPNTSKKNKKTGKVPMYMRVLLGRKKAETRLDADVLENEIMLWDEMTMRMRDRKHKLNGYLSTLEKKYEGFRIEFASKLFDTTPHFIRDYIIGKKVVDQLSVVEYIDHYNSSTVQNNSQLSSGTKINYRKAIKHFKSFVEYRKIENLQFDQLSNTIAFEFKDYLLSTIPELKKIGMTEPSALGNIKKFRTIFDRAVDEELLLKNPFKKVRLKNRSPQRDRLDISQIKQLYDLQFEKIPTQKLYRDLFLFSSFTGLAFNDLMNLTQSNLTFVNNSEIKLLIKRVKTGIITEVILPKHAISIIECYKSHIEVQIQNKILPHRSNKEVNVQLKIIGGLSNIPVKLTTHIAIHLDNCWQRQIFQILV